MNEINIASQTLKLQLIERRSIIGAPTSFIKTKRAPTQQKQTPPKRAPGARRAATIKAEYSRMMLSGLMPF